MPTSIKLTDQLREVALRQDGAGLTDGQLLECFVSRGEQAALEALVRRHSPMVWGVCRRILPNHQDAEDAYQVTFLVLVRKAATILPRHMVANWLHGVAHQTALKARTMATRRRAREKQVAQMPEAEIQAPECWSDLRPLLDKELRKLPDKYRAVLILCDLENQTRKQVARRLGLPEGTVAGQLARARTMLATRLARHGLQISSAALAAVISQNLASASLPAGLMAQTIKAASLSVSGQAAGLISIKVQALMRVMLRSLLLSKAKVTMPVLLGACLLMLGPASAVPGPSRTEQENSAAPARRATASTAPDLTGKVVDEKDKPVKGARVLIYTAKPKVGIGSSNPDSYPDCAKSVTSAGDGTFVIRSLDPSLVFRVLILAEGMQSTILEKVDPLKGPIRAQLKTIDLKTLQPRHSIQGRVVDLDGKPVVGAEVTPRVPSPNAMDKAVAFTDLQGDFVMISNSPIEVAFLAVQARGFAPKRFDWLRPDIKHNFVVDRGIIVKGRVVHAGKPVPGVVVGIVQSDRHGDKWISDPVVMSTDSSGKFQFSNVTESNSYYLYGTMKSLKPIGTLPALAVEAGFTGTTTDVGDLNVVPGHRVSGRILLSDGKQIPPKTRISFARAHAWDQQFAEVDEKGRFSLDGLPTEIYSVYSLIKGYELSPTNECASPLNSNLEGLVDRDIQDLTIAYTFGAKSIPQLRPANTNEPEFLAKLRAFQARREELLRGVDAAGDR